MPLEVEASTDPPDLIAFKVKAREIGLKHKRQAGACGVWNQAMRSAGIPMSAKKTFVTVQAVVPLELTVSIPNIEEYGGLTPEEQNSLMNQWLVSHASEVLPGVTIQEGSVVRDITSVNRPSVPLQVGEYQVPDGYEASYTSNEGRVLHLFPRGRNTHTPVCGRGYIYGRYDRSSHGENRYCAACVRRV